MPIYPFKLYEYAAIWHPEPEDKDAPRPKSEVVVEPTTVLAKNDAQAAMLAARSIPEEHAEHLDEIQIVMRPFG